MNQLFNNRYVRMAALTIGIGLLLYAFIWLAVSTFQMDIPLVFQLAVAFLGAGLLVYQFLSRRVM